MKVLLIVLCLLLSACAGLAPSMSPEQLKAAASDKNANVVCVKATGPWGAAVTTYVNIDRGVIQTGGVTVTNECQVEVKNALPILTPKP